MNDALRAVSRTACYREIRPVVESVCKTLAYVAQPDVLENPVPFVELEGTVPEKLSGEFVELVQNTLRLEKELSFAFLRFNLTKDEVSMHMPDGTVIEFGPARQLKEKSRRAAQIIDWCRRNEKGPQRMDFRFFENGQVFLTQID